MRTIAELAVVLTLAWGVLSACSGSSDQSVPGVLACTSVRSRTEVSLPPTPTSEAIALFPTFEGIEAAEAKLGWRPLESDGARFELELWNSSVDSRLRGPGTVRLSYVESASGELVTLIQGDACSLIDSNDRTLIPEPSEPRPIGVFSVSSWQVPVTDGTWIAEFETGERADGSAIFATVIANDLELAEAFIRTLQ